MIFIGTSGYNYPEWKGNFYPSDLSTAKMLPYYAARFTTVEINYTFYRMPSEKVLRGWADIAPSGFAFTLKAPRRITHDSRLRQCEELVQMFCERALKMGPKLGVLLFQLPPSFRKDMDTLDAFLGWIPPDLKIALEFRHDSWHSEEVYERLKASNAALCIADSSYRCPPS